MTIYAVGARPNRPQSDIIKAALGEEDENGVPFEVIEVTALRNEANYASTIGCQDTIIEMKSDVPGKKFTITHRDDVGRIRWFKDWRSGGRPRDLLANTQKNKEFLAMHFYDGLFLIHNAVVKAEVEAMAKKIKDGLTEKQKTKEEERLKSLKTFKGGGRVPTQGGLSPEQIELERQRKDLADKRRELEEREQSMDQKEKFFAKRVADSIESEVKVVHERAELEGMRMAQLRSLAREYYKLQIPNTMKKVEILELIFKPKAPVEAPAEQVTG
jgi:hypothetical protein